MDVQREISSWDDLGEAVSRIETDLRSTGYEPELVIGIARGGAILGAILAHRLSVKQYVSLNVEYYKGNGVEDQRTAAPTLVGPPIDLSEITGKRVLVVDDIVETGHTLAFVESLVHPLASDVRTACWYLKPEATTAPDFWAQETTLWIVAPWNPASPHR